MSAVANTDRAPATEIPSAVSGRAHPLAAQRADESAASNIKIGDGTLVIERPATGLQPQPGGADAPGTIHRLPVLGDAGPMPAFLRRGKAA